MSSRLGGPGRRPVLIFTQEHDFEFRPSNTKRMRTALVFIFMLMFTLAVCAGDNVIRNPGFEEGFSGQGVATGWSDQSSWAPVKVRYSEDRYNPHSGRSAQRIDVTEFKGGAVQFQTSTALEKGKLHTVSVWLRAKESMQVDVQLRKKGKPYSTYAIRSIKVGAEWQEVRFTEMISTGDADVLFLINLRQVGALWVDDVSVIPADKKGFGPMTFTPPAKPIPATLFGLHYAPFSMHKAETVKDSRPFPAVPVKTLRLWDCDVSWNWLERKKGEWRWDVLDNYIAISQQRGIDLILPIALSPTWASARSNEKPIYGGYWMGCAAEPADMNDWRNYLRTVVTRCKGKIKYYEGWNEPDISGFYSGSKAKLIELQKEMYQIVKAIDPAATVISPSMASAGVGYLDGLFQLGLAQWIDVVGYHFYSGADGPEFALSKMQQIRDMMKKYDCVKPLFNTEAGWSIESTLGKVKEGAGIDTEQTIPIELAGNYIARGYVLNWAMDIPVWCLYRWEGGMGIREDNNELKIAANAYSTIAVWLTGAVMTSCTRDENGTYTVALMRDGKVSTIMWNADESVTFKVPASVTKVTDVYGKAIDPKSGPMTVGGTPLLLE
jgi:hypothetical protein